MTHSALPASTSTAIAEEQPKLRQRPVIRRRFRFMVVWDSDWITKAAALPGRSLHLGVALLRQAAIEGKTTFELSPMQVAIHGMSRDASYQALKRLEEAGLIQVSRRAGTLSVVALKGQNGADLLLPTFPDQK